jgi:hypothetical protein
MHSKSEIILFFISCLLSLNYFGLTDGNNGDASVSFGLYRKLCGIVFLGNGNFNLGNTARISAAYNLFDSIVFASRKLLAVVAEYEAAADLYVFEGCGVACRACKETEGRTLNNVRDVNGVRDIREGKVFDISVVSKRRE